MLRTLACRLRRAERRRLPDRGDHGQRLAEATDELERQAAEKGRVTGRQQGVAEARRFGTPPDAA